MQLPSITHLRSIKRLGSKLTLRLSNLACIIMFIFMVVYCNNLKGLSGKCAVVAFYALREIYISLLSSQQWAFISTTLDKSTSTYLVSFSGIVSAAIQSQRVGKLLEKITSQRDDFCDWPSASFSVVGQSNGILWASKSLFATIYFGGICQSKKS